MSIIGPVQSHYREDLFHVYWYLESKSVISTFLLLPAGTYKTRAGQITSCHTWLMMLAGTYNRDKWKTNELCCLMMVACWCQLVMRHGVVHCIQMMTTRSCQVRLSLD